MKLIVSGLGRMGMQIAHKLAITDDHHVIAHNRSPEKVDTAKAFGAIPAYTKEESVQQFADGERVTLWIMLPAEIIADELASWFTLLPQGSLIIDGGNSDYRMTKEHAQLVADNGHSLVDIGTSGGIMGLKDGFCMMAGGSRQDYETLEPVLKTLAQPQGGYDYFGPSGAGHYVKMVHNAIEYGIMESLAEGYRMLREGAYQDIDLAKAGDVWQQGSIIVSALNRLSAEALAANPQLEGVEGYVAESGEARWTLETAADKGIALPAIQAAFDVRIKSQQGDVSFATKLLAEMRNKFGGHELNSSPKVQEAAHE
jgi:6-phosphogluconate dehydrogenase